MSFGRLMRVLATVMLVAGTLSLVTVQADARAGAGSSAGSRGSRTFSAPPPTNTSPYAAAPIQRSLTPNSPSPSPGFGQPANRGFGFGGGGFMSGLMGGFLGMGLAGLLFGHGMFGGYGGFGSIFGLIIQLGLLFLLVRFALSFFRGNRPAANYGGSGGMMGGAGGGFGGPGSFGAPPAQPQGQPINVGQQDLELFEQLLYGIQADWSRGDLGAMRAHMTPEMLMYFSEQLSGYASRGAENRVADVHLLQGDLSEAWQENGMQYATVAMRFSLLDWTIDRASGRVVDGDPNNPTQVTEIWTFVRVPGGHWLLSAIQQGR